MKFPRLCGAIVIALAALDANAELGGNVTTVQTDQVHMKATLRMQAVTANSPYSEHQLLTPSGVTIHEYADTNGVVFAVTWMGPTKPDLKQLLGRYFEPYLTESILSKKPGAGPQAISQSDLVVISAGHPGVLFGRAYVPSLVPQGVSVAELP